MIPCARAVQQSAWSCQAAACVTCTLPAGASGTSQAPCKLPSHSAGATIKAGYSATAGPQVMINSVQLEVARAARGRSSDGPRMHVHVDTWQM